MGFIITITGNNKWWYFAGTILFLIGSIVLTIYAFTKGDNSLGYFGIAAIVVTGILFVDALVNVIKR